MYYGRAPGAAADLCGGLGGGAGAGGRLLRAIAHFEFRVAPGRQFDRTYSFQVGSEVLALGTLAEPARASEARGKRWAAAVDATRLQTYMRPGMATRFRLDNVLSNTYNVPLWAAVTLQVFYTPPPPAAAAPSPPAVAGVGGAPASGAVAGGGTKRRQKQQGQRGAGAADGDGAGDACSSAATPPLTAAADVPDELFPLVPEAAPGVPASDSLATLAGAGDADANTSLAWPRAAFALPAALSEAGDVYRAQLVVTPKANGCEEFWAMNPSGRLTNSTCGSVSTGEPYREVRVYVDGEVAGLSPVPYTMYTVRPLLSPLWWCVRACTGLHPL